MLSLIFLAGGSGVRMGLSVPKQFLTLLGKPVALHSLEVFLAHPEISDVVVVCSPENERFFASIQAPLRFALPGLRRQDSVDSGLQACSSDADLILIHDAARPFLAPKDLSSLINAGKRTGAAALAIPSSSTMKICNAEKMVQKTVERSTLWQMQTPQIVKRSLLEKGFTLAKEKNLEVTDDVSLAEILGSPVEIVEGSPQNFKLTTPIDWLVAQTVASHETL